MDETYDWFLFENDSCMSGEVDHHHEPFPLTDPTLDLQTRAIDQLVKVLSKQARNYLLFRLQTSPLTVVRRVPYTQVKNSAVRKNLRSNLLLISSLISKGDPNQLITDTAEDLQIAKSLSIQDPYSTGKVRQRRRQAKNGIKEDLASRLLGNLAIAYKQNCKKRAEKKRVLSIAAPEITYTEGRRLFGCGPTQFSEAKKHSVSFGPFAEAGSKVCPDRSILSSFAKRFCEVDPDIAWKEFNRCHPDVAARMGEKIFYDSLKASRTPTESSMDNEDIMEMINVEYKSIDSY